MSIPIDKLTTIIYESRVIMSLPMDKTSTEIFGEWLDKKRLSEGLSMTKLGELAGASKQVISKYINQPPEQLDMNILRGIAKAFDMAFVEILRIAGIIEPLPEKDARLEKLINKAKNLDANNFEDVLDYTEHRLKKQRNTENQESREITEAIKKTSSRSKSRLELRKDNIEQII